MAKSKLSAEQFEEELSRQTTDYNAKRHELDDILAMAELYHKTIEEKDRDLVTKDARLKATKEKNQAELWQLNMELRSSQEALQHELTFHQTEVHSLSHAKQRYLDLFNDNLRLKASIDELESLYQKEVTTHATQLHSLNRERKDLRKAMEEKLRKDLAGLEIAFQQQAFDALFDSQKLAMFENAKLKDEVAMQGVGITNLTGRLAKQRKACDKCRSYLRKYRQKAERLREQLAIVTSRKNDIAKRKKELEEEECRLQEQAQQILHKHSAQSSEEQVARAEATVAAYVDVMREWRGHQAIVASWRERHRCLQALHLELKPTTRDEQHGLYPERLFPIYPLMRSFQNLDAHHPWVPVEAYLRGHTGGSGGGGSGGGRRQPPLPASQMAPEAASKVIGEAGLTGVSLATTGTTTGGFGGTGGGALASSSSMASPAAAAAPLPSLHLSMPTDDGDDAAAAAALLGTTVEGAAEDAAEDAAEEAEDDHTVSTTTSQSEFSLQSGSVHTENTSVGGQRRRMSRLKAAGDAIWQAIRCEDGLGEALAVIRGREKRTIGLIQLACEKEKAKLRRARRHERREQKRQQLYGPAASGTASPAAMATFGASRPRTGGGDGGGSLETAGGVGVGGPAPPQQKSIEPFEGQNMVAWAVMKLVHIWAQTRPAQIPDADLRSLSAESLQLLPTSLTQPPTDAGGGGGVDGSLTRSSPHDRRPAMLAASGGGGGGQQSLLTPQQVADHHFHQNVLRQLAEDKRHGLDGPSGADGGGAGGRLFDLPPDELSLSSVEIAQLEQERLEDELLHRDGGQFSAEELDAQLKRGWLYKPPAYLANPFAQQQQAALLDPAAGRDVVVAGVKVRNKAAYEIGPPLLLRTAATTATGGGGDPATTAAATAAGTTTRTAATLTRVQQKLRQSLSAGAMMAAPTSVASRPGLGTSTSTASWRTDDDAAADGFGGGGGSLDEASVTSSHVPTNAELRASDPLLHKPRRKAPGVSAVRVSPQVLRQLPRSLSTPLIATLQPQQSPSPSPAPSPSPLLRGGIAVAGALTMPGGGGGGGGGGGALAVAVPLRKNQRLAASTGALPRHR
eukprot:gene13358-9564_t